MSRVRELELQIANGICNDNYGNACNDARAALTEMVELVEWMGQVNKALAERHAKLAEATTQVRDAMLLRRGEDGRWLDADTRLAESCVILDAVIQWEVAPTGGPDLDPATSPVDGAGDERREA